MKQITPNTLDRLTEYEEAQMLQNIFNSPESIKILFRIRRAVGRRNEEGNIELINAGLINVLNDVIEQSIQEEEKEVEGEMLFIELILEQLVKDNPSASQLIVEKTDFIDHYLSNFDNLPIQNMKEEFLFPIYCLSLYLPNKQKKNLFNKGVVQSMIQFLSCLDIDVREEANKIIMNVIKAGLIDLKPQEKHPFLNKLTEDGTVSKLIQLIQDQELEMIHRKIAEIFANLFKASKLPDEIIGVVFLELKRQPIDINEISLLVECSDNINAIFDCEIEKELFKRAPRHDYTLQYLHLAQSILHNGSIQNKTKLSHAVKDKVERLTDNKYIDKLNSGEIFTWNQSKKEEIKQNAQQLLSLINQLEEQTHLSFSQPNPPPPVSNEDWIGPDTDEGNEENFSPFNSKQIIE
ncbi:MAG: hypothetical protein EZS28_022562 [Streblomastix strix]|uniref:Uncharacterized protein n=1 Tax=Streblomastix strix TaxID=222440 RepID=A0A5J4VH64_9EUKA|nr:MAG: hypothetical protein EZS28_022562 [Streblomastix strix]